MGSSTGSWHWVIIGLGAGAAALLWALCRSAKTGASPAPAPGSAVPGSEGRAPAAKCPPPASRVLLVGDSYSVGMAPYMRRLASACGAGFYHKGEVGVGVTKVVRPSWIEPAIAASAANVALVVLGGNDFGRGDPAAVRASIAALIARLRAAGMVVLWVSPPTTPFPDKIGVRQMWPQELGQGAAWFDSAALASLPRAASDPLAHPTPAGYELWATEVWLWMSGVLWHRSDSGRRGGA